MNGDSIKENEKEGFLIINTNNLLSNALYHPENYPNTADIKMRLYLEQDKKTEIRQLHLLILSLHSEFFRNLVKNKDKFDKKKDGMDMEDDSSVFEWENYDLDKSNSKQSFEIFSNIIESFYSGHIQITPELFGQFYSIANKLILDFRYLDKLSSYFYLIIGKKIEDIIGKYTQQNFKILEDLTISCIESPETSYIPIQTPQTEEDDEINLLVDKKFFPLEECFRRIFKILEFYYENRYENLKSFNLSSKESFLLKIKPNIMLRCLKNKSIFDSLNNLSFSSDFLKFGTLYFEKYFSNGSFEENYLPLVNFLMNIKNIDKIIIVSRIPIEILVKHSIFLIKFFKKKDLLKFLNRIIEKLEEFLFFNEKTRMEIIKNLNLEDFLNLINNSQLRFEKKENFEKICEEFSKEKSLGSKMFVFGDLNKIERAKKNFLKSNFDLIEEKLKTFKIFQFDLNEKDSFNIPFVNANCNSNINEITTIAKNPENEGFLVKFISRFPNTTTRIFLDRKFNIEKISSIFMSFTIFYSVQESKDSKYFYTDDEIANFFSISLKNDTKIDRYGSNDGNIHFRFLKNEYGDYKYYGNEDLKLVPSGSFFELKIEFFQKNAFLNCIVFKDNNKKEVLASYKKIPFYVNDFYLQFIVSSIYEKTIGFYGEKIPYPNVSWIIYSLSITQKK